MKKKSITFFLIATLTPALHGAVLVSWDVWGNDTMGSSVTQDSALTGFTATAVATADRILNGYGSNDGSFGTVGGASSTDTYGLLLRNANPTLTITVNNNTGSDYSIDSLHIDYWRSNGNAPDTFTLTYDSGGLGPAGTLDTVSGIAVGSADQVTDYVDYDFNLGTVLTDKVLANGESAVFTIDVTWVGGGSSLFFDNLAIQGAVVPEPSAALLGGLGALMLLRRRRN